MRHFRQTHPFMKALELLIAGILASSVAYFLKFLFFPKIPGVPRNRAMKKGYQPLLFIALCLVSYFMNNGCLEMHINEGTIYHGMFHGGMYAVSYAVPAICFVHLTNKRKWGTIIADSLTLVFSFMVIGGTLAGLKLTPYNF